jgi:CRP-like cAMP-binding protein
MASSADITLEQLLLSTDWVLRLPVATRDRVIADCYERVYAPRDMVARRGEPATSWIGVAHGLVKVSTTIANGQSMMFTAVPIGSWVGEGSVIKTEPRRYDLMAFRDTRAIHVPRATFMWLLDSNVEFGRYIIDHLNERTGQFLTMLEVSRVTDPAARVAGAICNLFNPVIAPNAGPLLNISQEEVGELAGLSRSTTNIALAKLKKLDMVRPEYRGLLVLDLARLRQFAFTET